MASGMGDTGPACHRALRAHNTVAQTQTMWRSQSIGGATGLADQSHGRLAAELPRYRKPTGAFTMVCRSRMPLCASHAHTHTQVHSTQQLEAIITVIL